MQDISTNKIMSKIIFINIVEHNKTQTHECKLTIKSYSTFDRV